MSDINIEDGLAKIGSDLLDKIIINFTPDEAIATIDSLVHIAVDADLTGEEKAKWVLNEALELVDDVWEWVLPRLIELLYKIMMGYIEDFRDDK